MKAVISMAVGRDTLISQQGPRARADHLIRSRYSRGTLLHFFASHLQGDACGWWSRVTRHGCTAGILPALRPHLVLTHFRTAWAEAPAGQVLGRPRFGQSTDCASCVAGLLLLVHPAIILRLG